MKKVSTILVAVLSTVFAFAQAPQKISYQAIVRNSENSLITNSPVGMKVSILQSLNSDTAVYVETHSAQTNENGLLNIEIGGGSIVSGSYHSGIFWAGGPYFLKTEIDPSGGTNYSLTTTSELLAVPYALYAHNAGDLVNPAMYFVGAYKEDPYIDLDGYVIITYLAPDKVVITIRLDESITLFGTIFGNTITIPETIITNYGIFSGSGIKVGDFLSLTLTEPGFPPNSYTFSLTKQ